jgi:hypothetical protein
MNLTVRHLKTIGYQASGLISDQELVKAVRAETRAHDYDEVILATGRQGGSSLARILHLDPIHQLRRRKGQRLVIFAAARAPSRASDIRSSSSNAGGGGAYPAHAAPTTAAHNPAAGLCPVLIRMRSFGQVAMPTRSIPGRPSGRHGAQVTAPRSPAPPAS